MRLAALDRPEKALAALEEAVGLSPDHAAGRLHLALALTRVGRPDEAMPHLRRALELRPGDMAVRYQIATVSLLTGKVEQARMELETILKEAPQFTEAHVSLATVYYRLKRRADGDREMAIVQKLNAQAQAREPGANPAPKP